MWLKASPWDELKSAGGEVDGGQDVTGLGISSETGARSEGEQLRAFRSRGMDREQDQPSVWVATTEIADVSERREGVGIEDRHPRAVGAKHHFKTCVLYAAGDDLQAGIAVEHRAQAAGQEVLEVGDDHGDGRGSEHVRGLRADGVQLLHRQGRFKG